MLLGDSFMPRLLGSPVAALAMGAAILGSAPASATDLNVVYPPAPPPQRATGYDYRLHAVLHKLVPVHAAPSAFSPVVFGVPSGTIPALTGRCTASLDLASIADRSVWYRTARVGVRWCEVAGLNSGANGWISGAYIRAF